MFNGKIYPKGPFYTLELHVCMQYQWLLHNIDYLIDLTNQLINFCFLMHSNTFFTGFMSNQMIFVRERDANNNDVVIP